MKIKYSIVVLFFIFSKTLCFGQSQLGDSIFKNSNCDKLIKVNNDSNDIGYRSFMDSLKVAVLKCDSKFIESHLFENVKSIYDVTGKKNFITFWKVGDQKSTFWNLMEKILLFDDVKIQDDFMLIPDISLYDKNCFEGLRPFYVLSNLSINTLNKEKSFQIPKGAIVYVDQMKKSNFNLLTKELSGKIDFVESCDNCKLLVKYKGKEVFVSTSFLWPLSESLGVFFEYRNGVWGINSFQIL